MVPSNPDIVILHLSDLHFGPYLQGVSKIGEWSSFAAPQDFNLLQGMETKVTEIFKKYKERLIVVVTGDMTTAAEPPAYESVNNYLRDNPFVSSKLRVGLELQEIEDKIYVVPGNHDVWLYGNWFSRWKGYAHRKDQYFKYFPEQLPNAYPLLINGISLTIYTIDTNRVGGFNPFNFKNVLGRGEVGKQQIGEIQTLHNNLRNGAFQGIPQGFDYNASLKVALMHHHLELPSDIPDNVEIKLSISALETRGILSKAEMAVIPLLETNRASGQLSMLDAMLMGKPVIISKTRGTTESYDLKNEKNALLVPAGDSESLIKAIKKLQGRGNIKSVLGSVGRNLALAHTTQNYAKKIQYSIS